MVAIPSGDFALEAEAQLFPGAPGVVLCHPHPAFGGRMDTPLVTALAAALAGAGLSTVRFNFRGTGGSGGIATGGHVEHEDVRAAAAWLRSTGAPRVALCGYSFGALMAMRAVARGEPVTAAVAIALPTTLVDGDPDRVAELERALARGPAWLLIHGDQDSFCDAARVAAWATAAPNARIALLPGQGHFFAGAALDDLTARVRSFLGDVL
ncbi:MAG TPA: alpha/beta fold hydrolase [Polyangia bacterium]